MHAGIYEAVSDAGMDLARGTSMQVLVSVEGLTKRFDEPVLSEISLSVNAD